jgi:hypothetical protein
VINQLHTDTAKGITVQQTLRGWIWNGVDMWGQGGRGLLDDVENGQSYTGEGLDPAVSSCRCGDYERLLKVAVVECPQRISALQ